MRTYRTDLWTQWGKGRVGPVEGPALIYVNTAMYEIAPGSGCEAQGVRLQAL